MLIDTPAGRQKFSERITQLYAWYGRGMDYGGLTKEDLLQAYWRAVGHLSEAAFVTVITQLHSHRQTGANAKPPTPLELRGLVVAAEEIRERKAGVGIAGELGEGGPVLRGKGASREAEEFYSAADKIQEDGLNSEESQELVMSLWGNLSRTKGFS